MKTDHFLNFKNYSKDILTSVIERGLELKRMKKLPNSLKNKSLGLIFEMPSTRTRVSFEIGMQKLGGNSIFLSTSELQMSRGESVPDTARVLSSMLDAVVIRTANHELLEIFRMNSSATVINGLSNLYHPCQILADLMTYKECNGNLDLSKVAWIGDSNNVCNSYIEAASLFDFNLGYGSTVFLGICFMGLGALVMYNSGISFSSQGLLFASQLIDLYTQNLGISTAGIISLAAFTTMFSTTITTLDASPRAFSKTLQLLFNKKKDFYLHFLFILSFGTIFIFIFFQSEMGILVQIATVLSFLTTPFFAWMNFKLVTSIHMPKKYHPNKYMIFLSWSGLLFLTTFTLGYLYSL